MSISDLIKGVKGLVIEDDETPAKVSSSTPMGPGATHPAFNLPPTPPVSTGAFGAAPAASPFTVPSTTVLDEKVYQAVLAKTNFNTTPVGKAIIKYYDALEGVITEQSARFKAAIAQAQKLDGITPTQVLATFDQMSAALETDAAAFQRVFAGFETNEITARQTKITSLQAQVEQLNGQIAQIQTELAGKQSDHANAGTQYNLAHDRRSQEIAAQKAQVSALLR
jgi:hypothetical protein